MRRMLGILSVGVVLVLATGTAAVAENGAGELRASFNAGLSGGSAIITHSEVAEGVASPQAFPEGRILPFVGEEQLICDELVVGTWVYWLDEDRAALDAITNEFKLDGEVLDTVRTPNKRISQAEGGWWFAEGVPVLGVLDPGTYDLEWTFNNSTLGISETINTSVEVDSAHC